MSFPTHDNRPLGRHRGDGAVSGPKRLDVDYDHHSPRFAETWPEQYRDMRAHCPVARTDNYGGFYVLSRYADVRHAAQDYGTFSSAHDDERGGIMIPPSPTRLGFIEMDPPGQLAYRRLLVSAFTPKAVRAYEPRLRALVDRAIDRFIEQGTFDVVDDLANPIPAIVTLDLMGLPLDDWERFALPLHRMVYVEQSDPDFGDVLGELEWIQQRLGEEVADRLATPRDDLVTTLATAEIDGAPIPPETAVEMLFMLLTGGVETSGGLIAAGMRYLSEHPDQRRRLIDDPGLLPRAVNEFVRYFSPSTGVSRTVMRDCELSGVPLRKGDTVWLAWGSAARDEEFVTDPDTLRIDRNPGENPNFGFGTHRCLGSHLVLADMRIILEQVLTRLPDFHVDTARSERFPRAGIINGYLRMPATCAAGARVHPEEL